MNGPLPGAGLEIRVARPEDRAAVLELLASSLGWNHDERATDFFEWKHELNPFGPSPGWVALDGATVVGFRTFLRWEFESTDGVTRRAVRAVDTATATAYQGRGIFRSLTMRALDDLAAEGLDFVFNTPNSNSRPGYLKMGWATVGHVPAAVRLGSVSSLGHLVRSRGPAERWSVATDLGRPAVEVLSDPAVAGLVTACHGKGMRTPRTTAYLKWRYGFGPLDYRAVTLSGDPAEGLAIFRIRRRGAAQECALVDVLVPHGHPQIERALVRRVARVSQADYVIRVGGRPLDSLGFIRVPRQGPMLTWRPLGAGRLGGSRRDWDLTLGDVELF